MVEETNQPMNAQAPAFRPEVQQAGRSWPRIVEDLLRFIPGTGHIGFTPLAAASSSSARAFNALGYFDFAEVHPVEQLDDHTFRYNLIFANTCYHLEVVVSSRNPSAVHDFHLVKSVRQYESRFEEYAFVSGTTSTSVTLTIRPPEFTQEQIDDFSEANIRARWLAFREKKPTAPCPTPAVCFNTLFKIIYQPLSSDEPKEIAIDNPTLNMRVNPSILHSLLFTVDEERNVFVPPNLHDPTDKDLVAKRRFLTRKLVEVAVLALRADKLQTIVTFNMENGAALLRSELRSDVYAPPSTSTLTDEQYGAYVALGATEYFNDDLLIERYRLQAMNDPERGHYYLEALRNIAQSQGSEELQVKVMELMSLGAVPLNEVQEAYDQFGLDMNQPIDNASVIIDMYKDAVKARPSSRATMQKALNVVANTSQNAEIKRFLSMDNMDVNDAYAYLNATENADDDTIKIAVDIKLNEAADDESIAHTALLRIAESRMSAPLLYYYENLNFGRIPEPSLDSAYSLLGVSKSMDEQSIITTFEIRSADSPSDLLELRGALKVIGASMGSETIPKYLEKGVQPEADNGLNWPVGLNNIGNTCYLNSLLQYYFTITPLREAVLHFKRKKEGGGDSTKKIGGRVVPSWEVDRAQDFIQLLSELFDELIHTNQRHVTPKRDLAYLALVPARDEDHEPEKETEPEGVGATQEPMLIDIENIDDNEAPAGNANTNDQDDSHPEQNVESQEQPTNVQDKENTGHKSESNQEEKNRRIDSALFGRQQDVTECIENVLFQIEAASDPTGVEEDGEQVDIVKELFYGTTKQVLENADNGGNRREKTERFSSLLVDVAEGPRDMYDALDSYFGEDIVSLDGISTRRSVTISKLPPILQIQVQRVQFDRVNFRPFKSLALLKFDEIMYADRYLFTTDPDMIAKRRQVWAWKVEINDIKSRLSLLTMPKSNGLTVKDTLAATRDWFRSMEGKEDDFTVSQDTIRVLEEQIQKLTDEIDQLKTRLDELEDLVKSQFSDLRKHGYKILAVFVHRGQATFGHYWIYINDMKNKVFRKYNDEYVTQVPYSEVFDESEENTATPYFLVYVREDLCDDFVDALVRDPEPLQKVVEIPDTPPTPPPRPSVAPDEREGQRDSYEVQDERMNSDEGAKDREDSSPEKETTTS
uniref:ubiquitinyl hydrolase 1 n=1 Tax=Blastobotrys adeninivorans TaxID=409370 RepID=A0A060T713_BLAAD